MIRPEKLNIDAAQPGMVLAAAISDDSGRTLLPAGTLLSESTLQSLARRGVVELVVEHEVTEDPAKLEARRAALKLQLDPLFRQAGEGAETKALYQAIFDFRLERGA